MVWADMDDDMADGDALKSVFWSRCKAAGISAQEFESVIFVFAKDRLENWIEYLLEGATEEHQEGRKAGKYSKDQRRARDAAKKLAESCKENNALANCPKSLSWSCQNWRKAAEQF